MSACFASLAAALAIEASAPCLPPPPPAAAAVDDLGIDPATLLQWREACRLVAAHPNAIWPKYDLGAIPALMLHPKKCDVLLRFPNPPPSFVRWGGPSPLGDEPLFVRRTDRTVYEVVTDTTTVINGVTTLVVTDRAARESPDDAWCLGTQVHEGFHAFAAKALRIPDYSELDLADLPDLDAERNARLELEGNALLAALAATSQDEIEEQALLFLAERAARQAGLPAPVVRAEEATEINEGLATYAEWRAHELWMDEGVSKELAAACPTLATKAAFAERCEQMKLQLRNIARHTMGVNGSQFGTAVVRRRGYFLGAAQGRLLDRLDAEWKEQVAKGRTLHELLLEALGSPSPDELAAKASEHEVASDFDAIVARHRERAAGAEKERDLVIEKVTKGPGTLVRIGLAQVSTSPLQPSSYTPFGVVRVAPGRRLFWMAPAKFDVGSVHVEARDGEVAILADDGAHELWLRSPTPAAELAKRLLAAKAGAPAVGDAAFELSGNVSATTIDAADGSLLVTMAK